METDLCSEWLPFISSVEILHKYTALRVLAKFSFKMPVLGERVATVHYQIFDNIETDGAIQFVANLANSDDVPSHLNLEPSTLNIELMAG